MKPPVLQTDWMNCVAFRPESRKPHSETFFLHASDPKHPRSLWVRLHLCCDGKERYGETQAVWFDDATLKIARERWPLQRIQIDPERAGVGIGESNIQDNASTGLVRGPDFALSWDLAMTDECAPYRPLPAEWLYRGDMSHPKFCTPHPSTQVSGRVELWHGLTRHTDVERVVLQGWRGMQGHIWGPRPTERAAWVHCNTFTEAPQDACFEAFAGTVRVGKVLTPQALVGRLWLNGQLYRFDTWRNLWGSGSRFSPTGWTFEMEGPQGKVKATLVANPRRTAAVPVPTAAGHAFGNRLAQLTLELTPLRGKPRTLHSERAAFDVVQPEPRGAVETAA